MKNQFEDIQFPGWEIVRKLGEGSFGGVYEIQRTLPDGRVERGALKKLSVPRDREEIEEMLSNSFSMIGALILGDFAVQARWLVPEVLVYMAFVAIANYAQHSYEMGYATKLCRMVLLVLIWLWDWWGFAAGVVLTLVLIATTKPLVGKGYLYPLIPFDRRKLLRLLYRRPINRHNS